MGRENGGKKVGIGLLLLLLIVAPHLPIMDAYLLFVLDLIYISVLVSVGLNLLAGYAGQISIGHAAFYAIGAYSSAILQERLGLPFFVAMILAAVITAAIGYIVGLPAIRLHGLFLAMATLAFGLVIEEILIIAEPLTYGANGMAVPDATLGPLVLTSDTNAFYYVCLGTAAIMTWVAVNIVNSRAGRAFVALRESEIAAETNGINLARYKTIAFALSAFYTGLAGSLYAQAVTFIAPDGFTIFLSIQFLAVIIIGGMGSILGSILGAITLAALPEIFATLPAEWGAPMIFYGAALILVIMFMPFGIAGWVNKIRYRLALRHGPTTSPVPSSASDPAVD
jgi:branched-chain amino acid transport system permease protein